jgi:hypothetical protein
MKSLKLRKIVAAAVAALTLTALSPIGASAEWRQDSNGWWNTEGSSYSIGWRSIDNTWYYFGSDGYMKTNWVNDGGTWYYMQPSGAMKTGWVNDGDTWYYLQSSGAMKTGWINDRGTWYYAAPSGAMQTGWVNDGGKWYFTNASGAMQTGVVEVGGKVYYLAPSGAMQTGNVTINGVTYTFAASGEAVGDNKPTPTVIFTPSGVVVTPGKGTDTTNNGGTSNGGTSGGGGGSSSSSHHYVSLSQAVVDAQYKAATKITKPNEVEINSNGTTTIKPTFSFTPGTYTEYISATGKSYTVTKDVYVTFNGKDAYITGNYKDGYTVAAGVTGEVEITASISVYDSENGKLYYATPATTEVVPVTAHGSALN